MDTAAAARCGGDFFRGASVFGSRRNNLSGSRKEGPELGAAEHKLLIAGARTFLTRLWGPLGKGDIKRKGQQGSSSRQFSRVQWPFVKLVLH